MREKKIYINEASISAILCFCLDIDPHTHAVLSFNEEDFTKTVFRIHEDERVLVYRGVFILTSINNMEK